MSLPANTPPNDPDDTSRRWWIVLGSALAYWLWRRWRSEDAGDPEDPEGTPPSIDRNHEPSTDADVGGVVAFSVALLVLIGVCLVGLIGLYRWFARAEEPAPSRFADVQRVPPEPRLQRDPAVDLARLHRRTSGRLHTYGWVDSTGGVVHIPIERAMNLVAERGLPYDTTAQADSVRRVMSESGFTWERRGPPPPSAPAYLGSSPEPFVPNEEILHTLLPPGSPTPGRGKRAPEQQ